MFWLLVTYLLMIIRCEYAHAKFGEDARCIVEHNKPTVASMIITDTNSQYFSVNVFFTLIIDVSPQLTKISTIF